VTREASQGPLRSQLNKELPIYICQWTANNGLKADLVNAAEVYQPLSPVIKPISLLKEVPEWQAMLETSKSRH